MADTQTCPCGSGRDYEACCEPCLKGKIHAATAEQLMRSRYTAYVMHDEGYLLATWHGSTRPQQLDPDTTETVKWTGLKIVSKHAGGVDDTQGVVEFVARYKVNGKAYRLHEGSRFVRQQDRWFYLDGELKP